MDRRPRSRYCLRECTGDDNHQLDSVCHHRPKHLSIGRNAQLTELTHSLASNYIREPPEEQLAD